MRQKIIYRIIIKLFLLTILLLSSGVGFSQKCTKKKLATKEMRLEYDYRGQSLFIEMSNGDTTTLNVILYSKQN
jgi:hypothetical protein